MEKQVEATTLFQGTSKESGVGRGVLPGVHGIYLAGMPMMRTELARYTFSMLLTKDMSEWILEPITRGAYQDFYIRSLIPY